MRLLMAVLYSASFGLAANAQAIDVRSGQHDGFVRLIIDLPERVEVKVENWREEAVITLPGQEFTFETSRVFDRISRDRVRDVIGDEDAAKLRVSLGCNCSVSTFWHGKSLLVLDVRDTDTVFPSIADRAPPASQEDMPVASAADEEERQPNQRLTIQQGSLSLAASLAKRQLKPESDVQEEAANAQQPSVLEETDPPEPLASEVREHLVKQLSRAATQGLISPRSQITPPTTAQVAETVPEEVTEPASPTTAGHINLRAQSSIDRDFLAVLEEGMRGHSANVCVDDAALDIGSWGSDSPFAQQVGPLRKDLIGEFDQVNLDAVADLTRLYLYFGFGAEARHTLSLAEDLSDNRDIYLALSAIMEDGHASNLALANQLHCDGPAALWAILSYETLPQDTQINKNAALRAFDALPRQLRGHLGPSLSRRFLDAGDPQTAENVIRILNRLEETVTAEADLVEAEIDLADGENAKAVEGLEAVVETNTEISAKALIELIDTSLKSENAVSYDHAILAGAYLQQNRGGELEHDLARVYLIGLAASGAFDQSYEERLRLAASLPPELLQEVDSDMLDQLTQSADEITFLRHVFVSSNEDRSRLNATASNAAATRLVDLGFADAARPFIEQETRGRLERERKILRAKISLMEGRPKQAEADLLDVEGDDAELLRAKARGIAGDHLAAADTYAELGDRGNSMRQAWLAEDWTRLLQAEERALSSGAALALLNEADAQPTENEGQDGDADRVLSKNRGLIQQSSAARETIEDVLMSNPSPEAE